MSQESRKRRIQQEFGRIKDASADGARLSGAVDDAYRFLRNGEIEAKARLIQDCLFSRGSRPFDCISL